MKTLKSIGALILISSLSLTSCSIPFMKKESSDATISESKTGLMQGQTTNAASAGGGSSASAGVGDGALGTE